MDAYTLKCIACDQQKFPDYQSVQQIITTGLCMYDLIETCKLKYIFTITFCEEHLVIEISFCEKSMDMLTNRISF